MEFGLREYLLILGCALIIGLLADGIRRTIKHKRDGLKLDLMTAPPNSPERSDVSAPRPARKPIEVELEPDVAGDPLFESDNISQLNLWASEIKTEQMKPAPEEGLSQLDYPQDASDESLFDIGGETKSASNSLLEPDLGYRKEPTFENLPNNLKQVSSPNEFRLDNEIPPKPELTDQLIDPDSSFTSEKQSIKEIDELDKPSGFIETTFARLFGRTRSASSSTEELEEESELEKEQLYLANGTSNLMVIQICPTQSVNFENIDLHTACLRAGLRFTEYSIYQRLPFDRGSIPLFSLVNGVEPGTFEGPAKVITTPLLFIFSELPNQPDPIFAVNELISGARSIAREIGGDVFDTEGKAISKDWIDAARVSAAHQRLLRS